MLAVNKKGRPLQHFLPQPWGVKSLRTLMYIQATKITNSCISNQLKIFNNWLLQG
jgi:hypothetical protein